MTARPLVLVALTGGGFSFETARLLAGLGSDATFIYLKTEFGGNPGERGIPAGAAHVIPQFSTKTQGSFATSAYAFLGTLAVALAVIWRRRVAATLVIGCSHAVPIFLASRLLGVCTIYVESVTRADRLSMTGKIVYHLRLARLFVIQWPDLQKAYPASRLGTII